MSDYIKREDAENIMLGSCDESALWKLRYLPSADVVEVRHGYWKGGNNSLAPKCSVCGNWGQRCWNYCPNCGARMRMTKEQYESHVGDIYEDGESE